MKYTLEFVLILNAIRDDVVSTYKMAEQTHVVQCLFCQLRKWPPAHMPGRRYKPVRPLVLIYNSMNVNIQTTPEAPKKEPSDFAWEKTDEFTCTALSV